MVYIEQKDFDRVQKLIDKGDDGTKMSKSIKDKNKSIRRYVASRLLTDEGKLSIEDFRNKNFGRFSSFANRAIELGATYFDITIHFIKSCESGNVIDFIIDEYLNEELVGNFMEYRSRNFYNDGKLLNYIFDNFISDEDKERLACDIYKIFL